MFQQPGLIIFRTYRYALYKLQHYTLCQVVLWIDHALSNHVQWSKKTLLYNITDEVISDLLHFVSTVHVVDYMVMHEAISSTSSPLDTYKAWGKELEGRKIHLFLYTVTEPLFPLNS